MAEKKAGKEVSRAEIRKVIREYIERVFNICRTFHGICNDTQIDCPACRHSVGTGLRLLKYNAYCGSWYCLSKDCQFQFPDDLTPPGPGTLENYYKGKMEEKAIAHFLTEMGISL